MSRIAEEITIQDGLYWFRHDDLEYGPYARRLDAEDDLRGLRRFEKYKNVTGFITTTPPEKQHAG